MTGKGTMSFEEKLEKYAEVIVKVGLNLQEGQRLLIGPPLFLSSGVPIENAPLVAKITKQAYKACQCHLGRSKALQLAHGVRSGLDL
jgi:leucyl aminopeptidase (aminopeptidase T)